MRVGSMCRVGRSGSISTVSVRPADSTRLRAVSTVSRTNCAGSIGSRVTLTCAVSSRAKSSTSLTIVWRCCALR